MVQIPRQNLKTTAIGLRKKGFSYTEIQGAVKIPKSTLSTWLKNIKLSESEEQRLEQKRLEARKRGTKTRTAKTSEIIAKIKSDSAKAIGKISKRELWLMGIVMYWKNKSDLKKGVSFSSSDPDQIELFLKWLKEIGGIKDQEVLFDIFIGKDQKSSINETVKHWSKVTRFPADWFSRVYYYKSKSNFLRVRVKASSMLARQIAGWVEGIWLNL